MIFRSVPVDQSISRIVIIGHFIHYISNTDLCLITGNRGNSIGSAFRGIFCFYSYAVTLQQFV